MMLMPASGPRSLAAPISSDMTRRRSSPDHAESAAAHGPTTTRPAAGRPKKTVSMRLAELERPRDHVALGELERERSGRAVEPVRDEREAHRRLPVHEAPRLVDEMQPAVLGHAVQADVHRVDAAAPRGP